MLEAKLCNQVARPSHKNPKREATVPAFQIDGGYFKTWHNLTERKMQRHCRRTPQKTRLRARTPLPYPRLSLNVPPQRNQLQSRRLNNVPLVGPPVRELP